MDFNGGSRSPRGGYNSSEFKKHITMNTLMGLAPKNDTFVAMMDAKMEREQKKLQMMKMEARLNKLRVDEEKMTKRINDAKKQQEFVMSMKQDKQRQFEMK
jgi:predicted  nucleic acid-binding Zn-ribbon protein